MVEIRRARAGDGQAIAAVEALCFGDAWSVGSIATELSLDHGRAWLAQTPAGAVGYLLAWMIGDQAEIVRVGTLPDQRGRGIGRALLDNCLAELRAEGAQQVLLEVHVANRAAVALYKRCGFAAVRTRRAYYPDGGDAMVLTADLRAAAETS